MRHLIPAVALAVTLAASLVACADDEPAPVDPTTGEEPSEPAASSGATGAPAALDWSPVEESVEAEVTVSGDWTMTVLPDGRTVEISGPERIPVSAPADFTFTDVLIDGEYAVVVAEHQRAEHPNVATVVDLASGRTSTIDGDSQVPTTVGGSWALGSGLLVHATTVGREYCLAVTDLATGRAERGPCVPPRHGITNARVTSAGITVMTFDDGRPSCRTLNRVEGTELVPLDGIEECHGWEAVATETSAVWGVVEKERRVEESRFYADTGDGPVDLGPGTTGTLTWCGEAAYFVRDPQRGSDPARLMRVDPGSAEATVVYESPGSGNAFLAAPRCGGTDLTVSAFTAAGDEQVTADVR